MTKKNKNLLDQKLFRDEFLEIDHVSILSSLPEIINLIISENDDLDIIVDRILHYILNLLNAAGGLVYITDYQKKYLRLAHSIAIPQEIIKPLKYLDFSKSLSGNIFKEKKIQFVENICDNKN